MRATNAFGALVASGLASQSWAQQAPEYGDLNDGSSGFPASQAGYPGGTPGGSSSAPTCVLEGTTTVFVTVAPSIPADSSDDSSGDSPGDSSDGNSGGSWPDGYGQPDGGPLGGLTPVVTVTQTLNPTTTVFVTSGPSDGASGNPSGYSDGSGDDSPSDGSPSDGSGSSDPSDPGPFVSAGGPDGSSPPTVDGSNIFTTLTVDIWGTASPTDGAGADGSDGIPATGDSGSSGASPTNSSWDSSSDPDQQTSAQLPVSTSGADSGSGSSPPSYGDGSGEDGGSWQQSSPLPVSTGADVDSGSGSPWQTVVTDADIFWTNGPEGPSQVTALSSHTLTLSGIPTNVPGDYSSGSDASNSSGEDDSGSDIPDTDGSAPGSGDSGSGSGNSGSGSDPGIPTTKTIIGPDGKPTVVVETPDDSGNGQDTPAQPSASFSNSWPEDGDSGSGSTTCATFTTIGPDGNPTVVHHTFTFPDGAQATDGGSGPLTTPDDEPWNLPWPTDAGSLPTGPPADGEDGMVFTTCLTYTTTGADGLPTPVHSTVVASFPNPITAASGALPTNIPATPGLSELNPQQPAIITGYTFTYVGADGLPTVVETSVIASAPGADSDVSAGFPTSFPSVPGGFPDDGDAQGISTCFTYVGADGLPTVVETTLGGSAPEATSDASGGFPTDFPSIPGGSPGDGSAQGITACFSYTGTGADGFPTVFDSTVVITPTSDGSAGLTTGLPSLPGATPGFPGSDGITTCFTFTVTGADGSPTPVETTLVMTPSGDASSPVSSQGSFPGFPSGLPSGFPFPSPAGGGVVTTYTYLGGDGLPTIVATTLNAPSPADTQTALPGGYPGSADGSDGSGITTCATYTYLGDDGLPTIVDSTYVIPAPATTGNALPGSPANGIPPVVSSPAQITDFPWGPGPGGSDGSGVTTCTSFTFIGADGQPTVIEQTYTIPNAGGLATSTGLGFPSAIPPAGGLPSGISPVPDGGAVTTCFTSISVGPDGLPTPVEQTVVYTPGSQAPQATTAGLPQAPPSGPALSSAWPGQPQPGDYGAGASDVAFPGGAFTPIFSDGAVLPGSGILPPIFTSDSAGGPFVTGAPGGSGFPGSGLPPSYDDSVNDDSLGDGSQLPGSGQVPPYGADSGAGAGALPSEITLWPSAAVAYGDVATPTVSPVLQTTNWANLIPEQTTTYTINYPLTTLATITPGAARLVRRQDNPIDPTPWANTTSPVPSPSTPIADPASPTLCPAGGKVGNVTLDFDDEDSGQVYNPVDDFWFSNGFAIVPPSSQAGSYLPSSGGQLVEFVPPGLSGSADAGSGDTAEIGVGPHFASPCFRFNLYGASLGCAAEGSEQWCEFDISAYTYNEQTGASEAVPWSEKKRVPACPTYPASACSLTPIELEGYTNITSVLITLRVGLDLRVWWGDDIRVGWTDNGCDAARCRADSPHYDVRRDGVGPSLRRRFWNLMPRGFKALGSR